MLKNSLYKEAAVLMADERFDALDPVDQEALKTNWANINTRKEPLTTEGEGLDNRDTTLGQEGDAIDERAASLNRRVEALNREIDDYNRTCANIPNPPSYCSSWRADLIRRKTQLSREVDEHNRQVAKWQDKVDLLKKDGRSFSQKVEEWELAIKYFIRKIKGLYDSIGNPALKKCLDECEWTYDEGAKECRKLEEPYERKLCWEQIMDENARCVKVCYDSFPGPANLLRP